MNNPPLCLDPLFTIGVLGGWLLPAAGVGALVVAGLCFPTGGAWRGVPPAPAAFRALAGLGFAMFLGGILWQFVGYWRIGVLSW
jgi:hypothetical protein